MIKINLFFLVFSFLTQTLAQKDTTIITKRDSIHLLQGVVCANSEMVLYSGQKYHFSISVSTDLDIKVNAINANIEFVESSKRGTGGMQYIITPIDTGICRINLGARGERDYGLMSRYFNVINYPVPPVFIRDIQSGGVIDNLFDSTTFDCKYPMGSGIFESYAIESWIAKLNDKTFEGKGNYLSKELINEVNRCESQTYLLITLNLSKNQTGHRQTEGIYIIK